MIPTNLLMDATLDGNSSFYYLKEIPGNFSEICNKVVDIMPKSGDIVFSTDIYMPNSVKVMEQLRRVTGDLKGEKTKKHTAWK